MVGTTEPALWATSEPPPETLLLGDARLRRWRADDLPALDEAILASKAHLVPWMPWAVHASPEDSSGTEGYLTGAVAKWADRTTFDYAIIDADGAIAGSCGLMGRLEPGSLEIGYWVHVAHTRRALATRAAAALTEAGLGIPDVACIEIHHDSANTTSGRVPERLGYVRLRDYPADKPAAGGTGVHVVWGMSRDAWPTSAGAELLRGVRA